MKLFINVLIVFATGVLGGVFWRDLIYFFILFTRQEFASFSHYGAWYLPPLKTSFILGLTALSIICLYKLLKIKTLKKKLIIGISVLLIEILTVAIRVFIFTPNYNSIEEVGDTFEAKNISLTSDLQIWLFMFVGLFLGLGIAWLIAKRWGKAMS